MTNNIFLILLLSLVAVTVDGVTCWSSDGTARTTPCPGQGCSDCTGTYCVSAMGQQGSQKAYAYVCTDSAVSPGCTTQSIEGVKVTTCVCNNADYCNGHVPVSTSAHLKVSALLFLLPLIAFIRF